MFACTPLIQWRASIWKVVEIDFSENSSDFFEEIFQFQAGFSSSKRYAFIVFKDFMVAFFGKKMM